MTDWDVSELSPYAKKIEEICKDIEEFMNGHRCHWAAVCKGFDSQSFKCNCQEASLRCDLYKLFTAHKLMSELRQSIHPTFKLTE